MSVAVLFAFFAALYSRRIQIDRNAPKENSFEDEQLETADQTSCTRESSTAVDQRPAENERAARMSGKQSAEACNWMSWANYSLLLSQVLLNNSLTDQYGPQMPEMARSFSVSDAAMSGSLQINWLVTSLAGLVAGPLSDRVGRRPVLLFCSVLLFLSTFANGCSPTLMWFYAGRVVQALGESSNVVVGSVFRDAYQDVNLRKQVSSANLICGLMTPMVAPFIGEAMTQLTGAWRSSFFLFAGVGVALSILIASFFEETHLQARVDDSNTNIIDDIKEAVGNRYLVSIVFSNVLICMQPALIVSALPFIAINEYNVSPLIYAVLAASTLCVAVFSVIISKCIKMTLFAELRLYFILVFLAGVVLLVFLFTGSLSLWYGVASTWIIFFCGTPLVIGLSTLYTQTLGHIAGTAGAVKSCAQLILGSILVQLSMRIIDPHGAAGFLAVSSVFCFLASAVFFIGIGLRPPAWVYGDVGTTGQQEAASAQ